MTTRGFDIRWRDVDGRLWKVAFESIGGSHIRIEYEQNGDEWRPLGCESVEDVAFECADGVALEYTN